MVYLSPKFPGQLCLKLLSGLLGPLATLSVYPAELSCDSMHVGVHRYPDNFIVDHVQNDYRHFGPDARKFEEFFKRIWDAVFMDFTNNSSSFKDVSCLGPMKADF
mmetsp:Transcript_21494/g.48533  ORF Transcript_21494/g.48533 Transcript_21494/m.48533 type:complete len:105 (+) Transcript_21494:617-931(+)